jgi:thiamine monophosphate kinase
VPIHEDAFQLFRQDHTEPLQHALHDGEDYELLFTGHDDPHLGTWIGKVVQAPRVLIYSMSGGLVPLEPKAWEHEL